MQNETYHFLYWAVIRHSHTVIMRWELALSC